VRRTGLLPCLWFHMLRQYTVGVQRPQALLLVPLGSIAGNLVPARNSIRGWAGCAPWG
jgi:MATE family multidrug resistance protein